MTNFKWSNFSSFFSATNTQLFLQKKYEKQKFENIEQLAFKNCYPFIYYLEHGKEYYLQAVKSPLIIQPILLFYGFVHLLKGVLLTINPYYPESTSVLAHGVSTRKRKKQDFSFIHDEVKVQKNGLFPYMAENLFHMKHLEGEKFKMGELFNLIPELKDTINELDNKTTFIPIKNVNNKYYIPKEILDCYHMTENRFIDFLINKSNQKLMFMKNLKGSLVFQRDKINPFLLPFRYDVDESIWMLPTSNKYIYVNEILIHYLLLYNLSMIARYETEWWSELVKNMPNKDYPLIEVFLTKTKNKGPFLIYQMLKE